MSIATAHAPSSKLLDVARKILADRSSGSEAGPSLSQAVRLSARDGEWARFQEVLDAAESEPAFVATALTVLELAVEVEHDQACRTLDEALPCLEGLTDLGEVVSIDFAKHWAHLVARAVGVERLEKFLVRGALFELVAEELVQLEANLKASPEVGSRHRRTFLQTRQGL